MCETGRKKWWKRREWLQDAHDRAADATGTRHTPSLLAESLHVLGEVEVILDFMRLLWSIEHGPQSTSKRMEKSLGITGPQRLVLKVVSRFPGLPAKEVAHVVRLHPSTLTGVIQRLAEKRLLVRARDPKDGRRMRLHATSKAAPFNRRSGGTVEAAVETALPVCLPVTSSTPALCCVQWRRSLAVTSSADPRCSSRRRYLHQFIMCPEPPVIPAPPLKTRTTSRTTMTVPMTISVVLLFIR